MLETSQQLPVTIITGFLGSGKTTLLNQILQNDLNQKVAVLVNEFGDINIDSQLLVSYDDDMVELSNGCICCTINEGLVEAVTRILAREEKVDRLIIETTGVADSLPIILTFVGSDFREFTHLDSVITLIDAETFTPEHFNSEVAYKQIAYGDILLLNKTDLASREQLTALETYIASVKNNPRVIHTQYAQVPLPLILDVGLTQTNSLPEAEHHEHHHHHSNHLEADGFVSLSFKSDRPFDVYKFQKLLTYELPIEVFRAKGIIWFAGSELRHIFQLCGQRSDLKSEPWSISPVNQLVFIGRHLDTDKLRQQLNDRGSALRFPRQAQVSVLTAWLLPLLSNLILFKFMTLAKSEPNQLPKIDNKLPKLTTTQQPPVSEEEMRQAVRTLLLGLGEDPEREGLKDTPKRVVKALKFLTSGYHQSLDELLNGAVFHEDANEMVLVRDIDLFSSCEHHILPILGRAHVAYIPDGKVIGLSKIARICEMYGRRLQVQERLTAQIADALQGLLQPKGVAVVVEASHMCMVMRGVQKPGSWTSTSAVRGVFADDAKTRQEFMSLIRHNPGLR